jgi:hypothetical protein
MGMTRVTVSMTDKSHGDHVRSHSHGSSFMHSDVLPFYTYTVVPELYFVVVTVSLVSLFIPSGGV